MEREKKKESRETRPKWRLVENGILIDFEWLQVDCTLLACVMRAGFGL